MSRKDDNHDKFNSLTDMVLLQQLKQSMEDLAVIKNVDHHVFPLSYSAGTNKIVNRSYIPEDKHINLHAQIMKKSFKAIRAFQGKWNLVFVRRERYIRALKAHNWAIFKDIPNLKKSDHALYQQLKVQMAAINHEYAVSIGEAYSSQAFGFKKLFDDYFMLLAKGADLQLRRAILDYIPKNPAFFEQIIMNLFDLDPKFFGKLIGEFATRNSRYFEKVVVSFVNKNEAFSERLVRIIAKKNPDLIQNVLEETKGKTSQRKRR